MLPTDSSHVISQGQFINAFRTFINLQFPIDIKSAVVRVSVNLNSEEYMLSFSG